MEEGRVTTLAKPSKLESSTTNYYPWFDWLRLGLAATVLLSHEKVLDFWPLAGGFAVQVFFALSGWLIGGLLFKLNRSELRRFYFNRAFRIWCPYFLTLFLIVAISLLRDRITHKWAEIVFYQSTFVYNIFGTRQLAKLLKKPLVGIGNHLWSVNAEEQFYLLAPLLLVLAPRRLGRSVITWVILAALAWVSGIYASIVFGVLAAVIANTYGSFHSSRWCRIVAGAVVVASVIGFIARADYALLAPVAAIAIVLLLAIEGDRHALGELAGGMSYPLYLNAWVAVFTVNALFKHVLKHDNAFARLTLVFVSSLILAAFLYWHVDRRILANRRRLYTPARAKAVIRVAYGAVAVGLLVGVVLYNRI